MLLTEDSSQGFSVCLPQQQSTAGFSLPSSILVANSAVPQIFLAFWLPGTGQDFTSRPSGSWVTSGWARGEFCAARCERRWGVSPSGQACHGWCEVVQTCLSCPTWPAPCEGVEWERCLFFSVRFWRCSLPQHKLACSMCTPITSLPSSWRLWGTHP